MQDSNVMHQTFAAAVLTDNVRCIMLLQMSAYYSKYVLWNRHRDSSQDLY